MHDPEPHGDEDEREERGGALGRRGRKEGLGLSDIISAIENKGERGEADDEEASPRKREMKRGPYHFMRGADDDKVKARVDARKHFEEILTGAKENNPKPPACAIYTSQVGRTQELAATLEKEAYHLRSKIDAGYDTLVNRYSGPLLRLQHYPLIAQELLKGSSKLNILKISKQTVDIIFEEKLDSIEAKLQRRQSHTSLP